MGTVLVCWVISVYLCLCALVYMCICVSVCTSVCISVSVCAGSQRITETDYDDTIGVVATGG